MAALGVASPTPAQVVSGTVIEEGTGTPLSGAMVVLVDSLGGAVLQVLTDDLGEFLVRAPRQGTYALRADRIGHASTFSPRLVLRVGQPIATDIVAPVEAIPLAAIEVTGDRRCVLRPEEGMDVARVWEEARKALAAAAFTDQKSVYRYQVMKYQRDLDTEAKTVENEQRFYDDLIQRQTFVSRPVEELMEKGFVQEDDTGTFYLAPDAHVLLSDQFLDNHCLRVEAGEDETEGLIGLAFEPVRRRREIDINGVFWLDRESSELQWLEYLYGDLDAAIRSRHLGGKVVFEGLPDGTWVVREWYIRMPRVGVRPNPFTNIREQFLLGIQESGAVVLRIMSPNGDVIVESETGVIEGVVLDSLHTRPLEGARVFAEGTDHADVTGPDGRYRLTDLSEGTYRVTYSHVTLDEIGFSPQPVAVDVRKGEISALRLLTPSRREVLRGACADEEPVEGTGVLIGSIIDAFSGLPADGATVTATWTGWDIDSLGPATGGRNPRGGGDPSTGLVAVEQRTGRYETTTGTDGRFRLCRVPAGPDGLVEATLGERAAEPERIVIEEAGQGAVVTLYFRR